VTRPQASEYLFYQQVKKGGAAEPAAAAAAAATADADAAEGADEEGDDEEEEDESELTCARIDAAVAWMRSAGIPPASIASVITAHPPVLAYDVAERLAPLSTYLAEALDVNGEQLAAAISRRPSILGLSVDTNLRRMVDYLLSMGTEKAKVAEHVLRTL
jgi:hypothetical protein